MSTYVGTHRMPRWQVREQRRTRRHVRVVPSTLWAMCVSFVDWLGIAWHRREV